MKNKISHQTELIALKNYVRKSILYLQYSIYLKLNLLI